MGKQEARKRNKAPEAGEAGTPSSSKRGKKGGKGGGAGPLGWPLWLWITGAIGLLVCLGQLFTGDKFSLYKHAKNKGSSSSGGSKKSGKGKSASSGSSKGGKKKLDTTRYLELALRLQEMTEVAASLGTAGGITGELATELDQELKGIESDIEGGDDSIARDLRAMISVVRGTIFQHGENLTDEQVEQMENSFTYANPRYWDDYYNKTSETERFDWYGSWDTVVTQSDAEKAVAPAETIGALLKAYLAPEHKILMLGCGNSNMSEQMYTAGFEQIVNTDISENLLNGLRTRLGSAMPKMSWVYSNASAMDFASESFDVTIDKGTLDAIEQNKPLLHAAIAESHRTLRQGGLFLSVTFNAPELRVEAQLQEAAQWGSCKTHVFTRPSSRAEGKSTYYLHACKRPSSS